MKIKVVKISKTAENRGGEWYETRCVMSVVEIAPKLKSYYKAIGCRCIDIQTRSIEGMEFDFIVDDEALCYSTPAVFTAKSRRGRNFSLCNTLLICKVDGEKETSLADADIEIIKRNFSKVANALIID